MTQERAAALMDWFSGLEEQHQARKAEEERSMTAPASRNTDIPLSHPGLDKFLQLEAQYQERKAKESSCIPQKDDNPNPESASKKH